MFVFVSYRYFPNEQTGISGFGAAPIPRRQAGAADDNANRGAGIFGGRGHVLGDHWRTRDVESISCRLFERKYTHAIFLLKDWSKKCNEEKLFIHGGCLGSDIDLASGKIWFLLTGDSFLTKSNCCPPEQHTKIASTAEVLWPLSDVRSNLNRTSNSISLSSISVRLGMWKHLAVPWSTRSARGEKSMSVSLSLFLSFAYLLKFFFWPGWLGRCNWKDVNSSRPPHCPD